MKKFIMIVILICFSAVGYADVTTVGSDDASNYSSWSDEDNQGTGFGEWDIWSSGGGGCFLASSAGDGFGDIDTDSQSFGLWGNPSGDNYANAQRTFSNWQYGYIFEIDLAIAWRSGAKGIDLYNSSWTSVFDFGAYYDNYNAGGSSLGWSYSQTSIFHLKVTQNFDDLDIVLTRGSDTYSTTVEDETLYAFKLFCGSTDSNTLDNLYFNNLLVKYDSTLPVELSTFTAQYINNVPTVHWSTQSENDNVGWFVYRNTEEDFTSATKVSVMIDGHGTTTQQQSYMYEDTIENPQIGDVYYYWLESVDYSGTLHHFDRFAMITIPENNDPHNHNTQPHLYDLFSSPNPFAESTNITFTLNKTAMVDVAIYDVKGSLVKSYSTKQVTADTETELRWDGKDHNGNTLSNGIYLYSVKVDGKDYATKQVILMK